MTPLADTMALINHHLVDVPVHALIVIYERTKALNQKTLGSHHQHA